MRQSSGSDPFIHLGRLRTVEELVPGDLVCCLPDSDHACESITGAFLRSGLSTGEAAFVLTSGDPAEAEATIRVAHPEIAGYLDRRQLTVLEAESVLRGEGEFEASAAVRRLASLAGQARGRGYSGARVVLDMGWAADDPHVAERLRGFQIGARKTMRDVRCAVFLQYDLRKFPASLILDHLRVYPLLVIGGRMCESPYYEPGSETGDAGAILQHRLAAISAHTLTEAAWRSRLGRFDQLVAHAPLAIAVCRGDGIIETANEPYLRMWGLGSADQVVGRGRILADVAAADPAIATVVQRALTGASIRLEGVSPRLRPDDGHRGPAITCDLVFFTIRGAADEVERVVCICADARDRVAHQNMAEEYAARMRALTDASRLVPRASDEAAACTALAALLRRASGWAEAGVTLTGDGVTHELVAHSADEDRPTGRGGDGLALTGEVCADCVRTGRAMLAPDLGRSPLAGAAGLVERGLRACAAAPVRLDRRVAGYASLADTRTREHDAGLLDWLVAMADILAADLRTRRAVAVRERRSNQLATIEDAARRLGRSLDRAEALETLNAIISRAMPCFTCYVSLFDAETELIRCIYAYDPESGSLDVSELPPIPLEPEGHGTQSVVIRSGEPLLVPDFDTRLRKTQTHYSLYDQKVITDVEPVAMERPRSAVVVPMKMEGRTIGAIQVFSERLNAYTQDDLELLNAIGVFAAAAVVHSELYRTAQDEIERRRAAEEDLRSRTRDLDRFFAVSRDLLCVLDMEGRFRRLNPAWEQVLGYRAEELLGHSGVAFIHPRDASAAQVAIETLSAGDEAPHLICRFRHSDGTYRWLDWHAAPALDGLIYAAARDVTVQRDLQEQVASERELLHTVIETLPEAVFVKDATGRKLLTNQADVRNLGLASEEAALGRTDWQVLPPEVARQTTADDWQVLATGQPILRKPEVLAGADGSETHLETSKLPLRDGQGRVTGLVGISHDMGERRRIESDQRALEARVQRAQRLESVGVLAGGIAHDFNNVLAAILGYGELAAARLTPDHPAHALLEKSLGAAERARELIRQILTFSRQGDMASRPVQLHPIVKEALQFLRASLPSTIEIRHEIAADAGTVLADPTQIHQIIMNLCTNAEYAMRQSGGLLTVRLEAQTVGDDPVLAAEGVASGSYVVLTVADTGCGMDSAVRERLFEPFFTTKPAGEGTGLGLATTHGIIARHGGVIMVQSELNVGTCFTIYLPRLAVEAEGMAELVRPIQGGSGHVLIVDDEPDLVALATAMLESLGYRVTAANSSADALALLLARAQSYDVILTDQTMPGMTGVELAEHARRIRPTLPVVLTTGLATTDAMGRMASVGIVRVLPKPYSVRTLSEAMRAAIHAPAAPHLDLGR